MKRLIFAAFSISVAWMGVSASGSAQTPASAKMSGALADRLNAASTGDNIRVIIEFETLAQSQDAMAPSASLTARAAAIEAARNALMQSGALSGVSSARMSDGVKRTYDYTPYIAFEGSRLEIEAFAQSENVKRIVIDEAVPPTLLTSTAVINAPPVWAQGFDGAGQAVAILDTGVDRSHSFFGGRVVAEACFSSNSPANAATTVCPNGQETQIGAGAGVHCSLSIRGCDHGTHVAGIAAGNEASALDGVAKGAPIIALQVFSRFDSAIDCLGNPPCALSFESDQIAALDHLLSLSGQMTIAAANMSLGGGQFTAACPSAPQAQSINNLKNAGVAVAIASGNNGFANALSTPACIPSAVSVGSTTDFSDVVSGFSNSASFLDLLAPGETIESSVPGNSFANENGTSMAAPHVAGAIAVLRQARPSATVDEIENALKNTGEMISDPKNGIAKPRIDLQAALNALGPAPATVQLVVVPLNGFTVIPINIPTSI